MARGTKEGQGEGEGATDVFELLLFFLVIPGIVVSRVGRHVVMGEGERSVSTRRRMSVSLKAEEGSGYLPVLGRVGR
jgi:hypothetical protein